MWCCIQLLQNTLCHALETERAVGKFLAGFLVWQVHLNVQFISNVELLPLLLGARSLRASQAISCSPCMQAW